MEQKCKLDKQSFMARIIKDIILHFFQQPRFWIGWVIIRVLFIGYVHKNAYFEVVLVHVLYLILYHQGVVLKKINTRNNCVFRHINKAILELDILPPRNEVMEHKGFQMRFQILYEFFQMGIMVLNSGSLPILTIFILANNFIPYVLLMGDLICLQLNWA